MADRVVLDQVRFAADGRSLRGVRVAVFGLGKSGLAAARLLQAAGATVAALDQAPAAQSSEAGRALAAGGVQVHAGPVPAGLLEGMDLVVVSPGVPLALTELSRPREAGVPLWGEIELAWRFLPPAPVVGITGTNGKSTTTALTGELFRQGGRRPFVGGNLGRALCEAPLAAETFQSFVVELSSFQLEGLVKARLNAAAILNLTPDHVDRYPSHEAYGEAKARIFANQVTGDVAVVNADDAHVLGLSARAQVPVFGFSRAGELPPPLAGGAVARPGGFHLDVGQGGEEYRVSNPALRGAHNLENAMAAALLARLSGVNRAAVEKGLVSYPGLPHRLELVRTLEGVEWINDSKATNVDSSLVALRALGGGVWLIAGGKGKGTPYAPLVEASRGKVKGLLTIGEDAPAIEAAWRGVAEVHPCGKLAEAVRKARALARAGDVVLLSPACASYDQFKNFEDRGDQFKRLVGEL